MFASLTLLVVARAIMSGANRIKVKSRWFELVPHHMTTGPMIRTQFNPPHIQMQVAAPSDDGYTSELWSNLSGRLVSRRKANITGISPSYKMIPPTQICDVDIRQLLQRWAELSTDPLEDSLSKNDLNMDRWVIPKTMSHSENKAMVLHGMRDVIAKEKDICTQLDIRLLDKTLSRLDRIRFTNLLSTSKRLKIVGSVQTNSEVPFDQATDALAVAVFSSQKLQDDRRGSLRKKYQEQYGRQWGSPWLNIANDRLFYDVFSIKGLLDAPGLPEGSAPARLLLSQIEKYAHQEQSMVVVSKQAYISNDGRDLTEYYVSLGFEKVIMEEGLHELVYIGASHVERARVKAKKSAEAEAKAKAKTKKRVVALAFVKRLW